MYVRLSDARLIDRLIEALTAADCRCAQVAADALDVAHVAAKDDREARIELEFFLRAWSGEHAVSAQLVA